MARACGADTPQVYPERHLAVRELEGGRALGVRISAEVKHQCWEAGSGGQRSAAAGRVKQWRWQVWRGSRRSRGVENSKGGVVLPEDGGKLDVGLDALDGFVLLDQRVGSGHRPSTPLAALGVAHNKTLPAPAPAPRSGSRKRPLELSSQQAAAAEVSREVLVFEAVDRRATDEPYQNRSLKSTCVSAVQYGC